MSSPYKIGKTTAHIGTVDDGIRKGTPCVFMVRNGNQHLVVKTATGNLQERPCGDMSVQDGASLASPEDVSASIAAFNAARAEDRNNSIPCGPDLPLPEFAPAAVSAAAKPA
jgi:hypothetical protein